MADYIFTSREDIKEIVKEAVSEIFVSKEAQKKEFDTISIDDLLELLGECGYKTTKGQIYKLTSSKQIPYFKLGNKLMFSKKEIIGWIKSTMVRSKIRDSALDKIQQGFRLK